MKLKADWVYVDIYGNLIKCSNNYDDSSLQSEFPFGREVTLDDLASNVSVISKEQFDVLTASVKKGE